MTTTPHTNQPGDLPKLGGPAQRALAAAGITHLEQIANVGQDEIKQLHGIGPKAIEQLRHALAAKGLAFADTTGDHKQ